MKKVILDLAATLDGFIEGPNREVDWCIMDDDMDFEGFLAGIDTIFYGRISYDLWGNFQPDENADQGIKEMYSQIHSKEKYVFSTKESSDGKARFIHSNIKENVLEIRQQSGKDIWLYGGGKLITTFINLGLIDVYRLAVHPIILGSGKPLFRDIRERVELELKEVKSSRSGVIMLTYAANAAKVMS